MIWLNPLSPRSYAATVFVSTFVVLPVMFLVAGLVANLVVDEPGRGFFDLRLALGPWDYRGIPFWILAAAALVIGHAFGIKKFASLSGGILRDLPVAWGIEIPYQPLKLFAVDLALAAAVLPLFFVIRTSTACL